MGALKDLLGLTLPGGHWASRGTPGGAPFGVYFGGTPLRGLPLGPAFFSPKGLLLKKLLFPSGFRAPLGVSLGPGGDTTLRGAG